MTMAPARRIKVGMGKAGTASFGAFTGCDIEIHSAVQSSRQVSLSNGRVLLSIVCNRDEAGDRDADAACESVARAITPQVTPS